MKKIYKILLIIFILGTALFVSLQRASAQGDPPCVDGDGLENSDFCVPLDENMVFLIIGGITIGVLKILADKKKALLPNA